MEAKLSLAQLKDIRSLHQKKFRDSQSLYIAEGQKLVSEALAAKADVQLVVGATRPEDLPFEIPFYVGSAKDLERISTLKSAPGVLAVIRQPEPTTLPETGLILALDGINDPGNLGTMMRTASWFGASAMLCSTDCVEFTNPKSVQSSMGAIFQLPVHTVGMETKLTQLQQEGWQVLAADMQGDPADDAAYTDKCILVIGSESHGVRLPETFPRITIPAHGKGESLNAGVAAGVILSAYRRSQPVTK